ncbi:MAG TPA: hypothetical protein VF041_11325 [Gemmatimonadaceae bacterium]
MASAARYADRYAAMEERALVLAMRRDDERAYEEFVARFHPVLLRAAAGCGVDAAERDALVVDVLCDVAAKLVAAETRVPRSVESYLVVALRHRARNARRDAARRRAWSERAASELGTHHEWAVLPLCSESSVRASRGAGWEASPLSPTLARLAAVLDAELEEEERRVVEWLANGITHREIAEWLGIRPAAASKRIERLRARLRDAAERHASECAPGDRAELDRFFGRIARGE